MINYYLSKKGYFTDADFESQLTQASIEILKQNNLSCADFERIRLSKNQGYSKSKSNKIITYYGNYSVYKISKQEKTLGFLNCFLDKNNLLEFFT
ncbi:hypothetical protein [Hwangdonia sp.]|uniref:hypothetical protein n=1 Tax=Hwangdonia sp. TaxID=1883432 RepID=UPI003AB2C201